MDANKDSVTMLSVISQNGQAPAIANVSMLTQRGTGRLSGTPAGEAAGPTQRPGLRAGHAHARASETSLRERGIVRASKVSGEAKAALAATMPRACHRKSDAKCVYGPILERTQRSPLPGPPPQKPFTTHPALGFQVLSVERIITRTSGGTSLATLRLLRQR